MKLKQAIQFLDKSYAEIKFREPVGTDFAECGVPIKLSGGQYDEKTGKVDSKAVHNLMIACSDVPREVIDMLKPADWMAGMGEILGFLQDGAAAPTS